MPSQTPPAKPDGVSGGLARMFDNFREKGTPTDDPDADRLLRDDPNALLLGVLFDQRVRAEYAYSGPHRLKDRLGHLDMKQIAEMDEEDLKEVFKEKPAVHRFTNTMAERLQKVAQHLAEDYDGDAAQIWRDDPDADTLAKRVKKLPGFGPAKASKLPHALLLFGYV